MQAPGVTWGDTKRRRLSAAIVAAAAVGLAGQGVVTGSASASSVRPVSADPIISLQGEAYSPVFDAASPQMLASSTGANKYWSAGYYGQGIGVAVLDSGVSKVDGLHRNVFYGPDLSPEGRDVSLANLDTFGHGTFMSGLIAGRTDAATRPYLADYSSTSYVGTAPEATIISVKVADALGNTQQSTIIRGIDWVIQHRFDTGLNIRVLNLSLGAVNTSGYLSDALSAATERAWAAGIVVVAAAGNDGTTGLLLPAADPYLIAVGAIDNINTVSAADDKLADFSNRGKVGIRTPEFSAPGTHVIGLRVPGSYIDTTFSGTGAASPSFFRGSGTSEAAAITSGAAALVLSQNPSATPDQVKAVLTSHAMLLPGLNTTEAGRGGLYVAGAFAAPLTSDRQSFPHAADWLTVSANWLGGSWSNNVWTGPGSPAPSVSESGSRWTGSRWTGSTWTGSRWTGATWNGSRWTEYSWR